MRTKSAIWTVLIAGILFSLTFNCKKESIKTAPTVTLQPVSNITSNSASAGGEVTSDGGATVMARGICWNTTQNPTVSDAKTSNGTGKGDFTSSLTGLLPGTTYYLKSYGTNAIGTGYSSQSTFTTLALAPVLTTTDLSSITSTSATSGGNITSDGGSPITVRGICWGTNQDPTTAESKTSDGTGSGSFTSLVSGLTPGKTYYFRAYATNSIGTAYGNMLTISISPVPPTVSTTGITELMPNSAVSGGNITNNGGSAVTARGVCWGTATLPTIASNKSSDGSGTGTYTSSLTSLTESTTYFIRAYATNSAGTGYGDEVTMKTISNSGTVTDIEGNVYKCVTIGNQVWMSENLKTTLYNDGSAIPLVTDNNTWKDLITPGYCWFNNDIFYKNSYGALYNWLAVNMGKLAPAGWHVPSDAEWSVLTTFLGNENIAGGKMKEAGTSHWKAPNQGATNASGFTGLPGGYRDFNGLFQDIGDRAGFWTTSIANPGDAWLRELHYSYQTVNRYDWYQVHGYSVRCIKNDANYTVAPSLTTSTAANISQTTATSGGNVTSQGSAAVTARGVCWSTSTNPTLTDIHTTDGTGTGSFPSSLTGLTANTLFFVRAYATNGVGTTYGDQVSFTTQNSVGLDPIADFTASITTVSIGQSVQFTDNSTNTPTSWFWDFGDGSTSTDKSPAHSYSSAGTFTVSLKTTNTYGNNSKIRQNYIIVSQTSSSGIIFNPDLTYETVDDNDGNTYKTIRIGTQVWMAENLKTTKYRNGDQIELVTDASWAAFAKGAYCWCNNDETTYKATYGALYNWFAVGDSRSLAPVGWHVATDEDWTNLANYLVSKGVSPGGALKETGFTHWSSPNTGATNSSGFTALPASWRSWGGISFGAVGFTGYWWSSTESTSILQPAWDISYLYDKIQNNPTDRENGFSVRCVKD